MATQEQIEMLLEQLSKASPSELFESTSGVNAVGRCLYEANGVMTAGQISNKLNISTARVAVLLKKMVAKGLIEKCQNPLDARVVDVKLTGFGVQIAEKNREKVYLQAENLIDKLGMEKMIEFTSVLYEIKTITGEADSPRTSNDKLF